MVKNLRKRLIFSTISVLILLVVTITKSYAWYVGYYGVQSESSDIIMSSMGKYYDSGEGTKDSPYIIKTARQLYNLAWLQDLGYYDEDDDSDTSTSDIDPFYFELGANIDMSTLTKNSVVSPIPPIGIDKHPFVSNFDGNGYVVNNLYTDVAFSNSNYITPSTDVLNEHTESYSGGYILTNYVGMFGYAGSSTKGTELDTNITDFTIAKAKVATAYTCLLGFVAGYSDMSMSKIGVYYSNFDLGSGVSPLSGYEYISNYGLVGDYNADEGGVDWTDKPTQDGAGYGSSTDIYQLYQDLGATDGKGVSSGECFPFREESSTAVSPSSSKISVRLSSGIKQVTAATTHKASSKGNNLGYYSGADIKVYNKTGDYSKFYYPSNSSQSTELPMSTVTTNSSTGEIVGNAPSDDIVEYLTETQTASDGTTYRNGDYLIRLTGTQQIDISNESGQYAVENAVVGSWTGTMLIPNRCIWVAPVQSGTMKFVLMNVESSSMGFRVMRLIRSTPGDYSTYFTSTTNVLEFNNLLLSKKAYYFEIAVSDDDIAAGYEYAVTGGDGYKPYLAYIDLGVTGGTSDSNAVMSNIDFVYSTSSTTSGYNEVNSDTLSKVGIMFTGKTTENVTLFVYRNETAVYYYVSSTDITVTAYGKGKYYSSSTSDFE